MGWHDDPEARLVEQFPIAPLTGAEIPVQVAERHNAAVKMPLVQVEVPGDRQRVILPPCVIIVRRQWHIGCMMKKA